MPWHLLNLTPEPHPHGSLTPTLENPALAIVLPGLDGLPACRVGVGPAATAEAGAVAAGARGGALVPVAFVAVAFGHAAGLAAASPTAEARVPGASVVAASSSAEELGAEDSAAGGARAELGPIAATAGGTTAGAAALAAGSLCQPQAASASLPVASTRCLVA